MGILDDINKINSHGLSAEWINQHVQNTIKNAAVIEYRAIRKAILDYVRTKGEKGKTGYVHIGSPATYQGSGILSSAPSFGSNYPVSSARSIKGFSLSQTGGIEPIPCYSHLIDDDGYMTDNRNIRIYEGTSCLYVNANFYGWMTAEKKTLFSRTSYTCHFNSYIKSLVDHISDIAQKDGVHITGPYLGYYLDGYRHIKEYESIKINEYPDFYDSISVGYTVVNY